MSPGKAPEQAVVLGGLNGAADPLLPREDPDDELKFIRLNAAQARIRLRGCSLELAGYFTHLRTHFRGLGNEVYYRVEMTAIYLCRSACDLGHVGWGAHNLLPNPYGPSLTADDYINIIKLREAVIKKWMMFVWYSDEDHIWVFYPQLDGNVYSLQECLDIFELPANQEREVTGFGRRVWTVGEPVPRCYLAKDLPLRFVVSKIREVMRKRVENGDAAVEV